MTAAIAESTALDPRVVDTIVDGRFSDAGKAIGSANLATLQAAAQGCKEAAQIARQAGQPFRQYDDRAILCRGRIRQIVEKQKNRSSTHENTPSHR